MFLDDATERAAAGDPAAGSDADPWVRCAGCDGPVARRSAAIAIDGAHEHERMNPASIRFVVRCFGAAPGCRPEGPRSAVWSWFPPRAWQIELCRACGAHLGWSFHEDGERPFWGLVRDHLR